MLGRILLVEDYPIHILLVQKSIEAHPIHLDVVKTGRDALEFLWRRGKFEGAPRPDVVVLDLNLPDFSGLQVLDQMKAKGSPVRRTPVVIMTSSQRERDILAAYDRQIAGYFIKDGRHDFFDRIMEVVVSFYDEAQLPS